MNCQSIKNKRSLLKESVDYIKPDAIIGCESWLSSDYTNSEIFPCGYQTNVFRKDQNKNGGGVFISVHESLTAIEIDNNNSNCEVIWAFFHCHLGFTLDCHLTMNAHVSNIARTCYFELRRLAYIRRFLTSTATATLVSAFVLSRIDYCNSLLFGSTLAVTSHLQRIQNYAARVILRLPMSSRITIHLKSLHWLPVKVRSTYKIACLCYHCHSSTAPSYVTDMLHKKPLHTRNTRSSSYTMPLLNRPAYSKATLGDRSFSFASSSVWNSIPNDVKCAPSLSSFKSRLKTYLFHSVYKD